MHFHEQGVIGPTGSTVPLVGNTDRHHFGIVIDNSSERRSQSARNPHRSLCKSRTDSPPKQKEIDSRSLSILNRCLFQVVDYEHLDRGLTPF